MVCDGLVRFSGMVLWPLPHHCCQPARSFFPHDLEGPEICAIGSQSVAVKLLFSFFGDLLSMPPFSFCVADSEAIQVSRSQLIPSPGRHKDILSKVRPFILEKGNRYSLRGVKRKFKLRMFLKSIMRKFL